MLLHQKKKKLKKKKRRSNTVTNSINTLKMIHIKKKVLKKKKTRKTCISSIELQTHIPGHTSLFILIPTHLAFSYLRSLDGCTLYLYDLCMTVVKNLPTNTGDTGDASSTPGLVNSPGKGNGNPLQHSCLRNPMKACMFTTSL